MAPANIVRGQRVDSVKLVRAKELRREMTVEEKTLWQALRANRLNGLRFRRQQVIDGFIVDFYGHTAGVIVEVDGPVHLDQAGYDAERDALLSARGFRILRVTNKEVRSDMHTVIQRIVAAVNLSPPPPPLRREGGPPPSLLRGGGPGGRGLPPAEAES